MPIRFIFRDIPLKYFSQKIPTSLQQISKLAKSDIGIAAILTLSWQALLTIVGYLIDFNFRPPATGILANPDDLLRHTLHWDAGWYQEIILSDFYQHTSSEGAIFAFYPLYPLLVKLVSVLSFGLFSLPVASNILTTIATIATLTALIKIGTHLLMNRRPAILIALLFITSPAAMFLHVFYSEAVFISIGAWAYFCALKRRWVIMAILLATLTAARLPSVLFIALCGLEFLRSHQWKIPHALRDRSLLWFLLTPVGFIVYSLWCYIVIGDPLAMFHAYTAPDGWPYQVFNMNIISTLFNASLDLYHGLRVHGINPVTLVYNILPLGSLALLSVVAIYGLFRAKGPFVPLGIFSLLSLVLFTLNSNIISAHRYSLACLSIFIIIVLFSDRHPKLRWLLYAFLPVGLFVQLKLLSLFIANIFAG